MSQPVDILVNKQGPVALAGAHVQVWQGTTRIFHGNTDVVGKISGVLLPGIYEARVYVVGMLARAWSLEVLNLVPPALQEFTLDIEVETGSIPTDPKYCRLTGTFSQHGGAPAIGQFTFHPTSPVYLLDGPPGTRVLVGSKQLTVPASGRAVIDLLRGAIYTVESTFWQTGEMRYCRVPDQLTGNLVDAIWPQIAAVTWPVSAPTMQVGDRLDVTPDVLDTVGVPVEPADYWLVSSDPSIVSVETTTLVALRVGTCAITVQAADQSIPRVPALVPTNSQLAVQVTP